MKNRQIKLLMSWVVIIITASFVLYTAGAWSNASLNLLEWTEDSRNLTAVFWACAVLTGVLVTSITTFEA
jgi:hypothetical protein